VNIKILSLISLLSVNILVGGVQKEYIHLHDSIKQKKQNAKRVHAEELEELYKTEKGYLYKISHNAWEDCLNFSNYDNESFSVKEIRCNLFKEFTKNALKELKETEEYNDYRDAMLEEEYYTNIEYGINKILRIENYFSLDNGYTKEDRKKEFNAIIDNINPGKNGKASEVSLKLAEDFQTERIQNKLRSMVQKIEAKNHPKQN
jgi:hypothetical protein